MATELLALNHAEPIGLDLPPIDLLVIAGLLQLANKHEKLKPSQREVIARFIDVANVCFEGLEKPYVLEVLRRGEQREE